MKVRGPSPGRYIPDIVHRYSKWLSYPKKRSQAPSALPTALPTALPAALSLFLTTT